MAIHQLRVDILLVLECHYKNASRLYAERYPNCRHPNLQQIINIERRSRQNPLYRRRQQNQNINNNDQRLIAILVMIHLNPHVSLWQIELGVN